MAATGADPEIVKANAKARSKRYYEKHKTRLLEQQRVRNASPEKVKYRQDRYQQNRETILEKEKSRTIDHKKVYQKLRTDPEKWAKVLERQRKRNSGITSDHESQLLVIQNNCCAACKRSFDAVKIRRDHCHDTKTPRGLLCHLCNTIEGQIRQMKITPLEFAQNLSDYLESPPFLRVS